MPYKYVVSVDSKAFNTAPDVILAALGRLTWAARETVKGDEFRAPNELLTLGYFEKMSIGVSSEFPLQCIYLLTLLKYHDDGESSLGPSIATLSLGGKATMSIRMKDQYYNGCNARTRKPLANDPILPGCAKYEEKMALERRLGRGEINKADYETARKEILKEPKRKEAPPSCVMELNHGDLVVMHGRNLQKYYEVSRASFAISRQYRCIGSDPLLTQP